MNKLIRRSDIILEIIDARLINETRNPSIENKIKGLNKKLILVVNKIDLINKGIDIEELRKVAPVIMFSCKNNYGKNELIKTILSTKKRPLFIGVIGYPNTGKSSLINVSKSSKQPIRLS